MLGFNPLTQEEKQVLEQYRQQQQMYPTPPQYFYPNAPIAQVQQPKKKTKKKTPAKKDDLSFEAKLWIAIIILSFFSVLVIKDEFSNSNPQKRVEQRAKQ
jgi:hypothetical protein